MTGCDANLGFSGKGKKLMYDQVAMCPMARQQLLRYGESLDLKEEMVDQMVTRHVIYGDNKSSTIADARAVKLKIMKNK